MRQENIGRYFVDFACREAKLIIEADGSQHADNRSDAVRDRWLGEQGYRVMRFWNSDIMTNPSAVFDTILAALPTSLRLRGEDRDDLVVVAVSPKGEGEGASPEEALSSKPPHPRLPPRFADDEVGKALSPRAGRGGDAR